MIHVGVGSTNPAKLEAVRSAFEMLGIEANIEGIEVDSHVSAQPFSDEETIQGAVNRAKAIMAKNLEGFAFDYAIGLEGGVGETLFGYFVCNWGAIINKEGTVGIGGGNRVQLPNDIVKELLKGKELGDVIDAFSGKHEVKKHEGTIGILTNNLITRKSMFRDVVLCAFARFMNPEFYEETLGS